MTDKFDTAPRRAFILGSTAISVLSGFNQKAWGAIGRATLSDPANRLPVYARIRGNGIDGPRALWWISGIIYAKRYGEMAQPLFRVIGISWNRISSNEDGKRHTIHGRGRLFRRS